MSKKQLLKQVADLVTPRTCSNCDWKDPDPSVVKDILDNFDDAFDPGKPKAHCYMFDTAPDGPCCAQHCFDQEDYARTRTCLPQSPAGFMSSPMRSSTTKTEQEPPDPA